MYSTMHGDEHGGQDDGPVPACLLAEQENWHAVGRGTFKWSVFNYYEAQLYCSSPRYVAEETFALSLHYLRKIDASTIVGAAVKEMQRLADPPATQLAEWEKTMNRVFPSVVKGDRITGVFLASGAVHFYFGKLRIGALDDAGFRSAFAAIWLDPRTQAPALRQALLGSGA